MFMASTFSQVPLPQVHRIGVIVHFANRLSAYESVRLSGSLFSQPKLPMKP